MYNDMPPSLLHSLPQCDMLSHVYRQIKANGYGGVTIQALYRDEVQDFTQVRESVFVMMMAVFCDLVPICW